VEPLGQVATSVTVLALAVSAAAAFPAAAVDAALEPLSSLSVADCRATGTFLIPDSGSALVMLLSDAPAQCPPLLVSAEAGSADAPGVISVLFVATTPVRGEEVELEPAVPASVAAAGAGFAERGDDDAGRENRVLTSEVLFQTEWSKEFQIGPLAPGLVTPEALTDTIFAGNITFLVTARAGTTLMASVVSDASVAVTVLPADPEAPFPAAVLPGAPVATGPAVAGPVEFTVPPCGNATVLLTRDAGAASGTLTLAVRTSPGSFFSVLYPEPPVVA
jgi:hypothetical protein